MFLFWERDQERDTWTLIDNGKLTSQIARLVENVVKKWFIETSSG